MAEPEPNLSLEQTVPDAQGQSLPYYQYTQKDAYEKFPQAFRDRLEAGRTFNERAGKVVEAAGKGIGEAINPSEPLGIEPGGQMEKDLQDAGIFNKPGEVSPLRTDNEAWMRPTAATADMALRLLHAPFRAGARALAEATAAPGDTEDTTTKNTNELDTAAQLAGLLAGTTSLTRLKYGPHGTTDETIGGLPVMQDFTDTARVATQDAGPTQATADKLERIWQDAGHHPAEVQADAERDPVVKQQLLSSTPDVPDKYAGITPARFGRVSWSTWDDNATATRQLPNGEVVPAPEAVADYLQKFGEEAGFKFQVGPPSDSQYGSSRPHFATSTLEYPDGTRTTKAQVYMPDTTDYQMRQWYGLGRNEVLFHEVGHGLDNFVLNNGDGLTSAASLPKALREEMIEANKRFAPKLWAENSQYRSKGSELMADSIAAYLSNPEIRKDMPLFTAKYGPKLEKYKDIVDRTLPKKVDGEWQMPPDDEPAFQSKPDDVEGKVPVGNGGAGGPPDGRSPSFEPYEEPPDPKSLKAAQDKILDRISVGEDRGTKGFSFNQLYTNVVDKFFPISKARQGAELTAANDPYKLVRLLAGWTGKADHMLNEGTFDFNTFQNNGPSMKDILEPVAKDMDGFRAFAAAARAAELESRGLSHGFDLEAVKQVGQAGIKKYGPVLEGLVKYQNRVSAYLRDSGVLSDKAYDNMVEANKLFVPFHRVMGDDAALGQKLGGANMTASNPIKTLKGSEKEVIDPIESIVKNTYLLTSMAEKNNVGTKLIDMLIDQRAHEALDGRPPEMSALPQIGHNGGPALLEWAGNNGVELGPDLANVLHDAAQPDREGEISIFRDGTRFTYKVDADLARSFKGLDASSIGLIEKLFAPMAKTLRTGAVLNPEFAARHTVRDFLYSFIQTTTGVFTPVDTAKGLASLVMKDQDYWQWMKAGGANGTLVSLDRQFLQESLNDLADKTGLFTRAFNVVIDPQASYLQKGGAVLGLPFKAIGKYVVHPLQMIAETAMNMNHLAGFKRALRTSEAAQPEGTGIMTLPNGSPTDTALRALGTGSKPATKEDLLAAGWQSRNTGIDVARSGAKMSGPNMISAFLNAKIQDTFQIAESMAKTPISTGMRIAAGITIPSLALWYSNKDDSRYQDLPSWEKDVFWIVPTDKWEPATAEEAANRCDPMKVGPCDQVRVNNGQLEQNNGHIFRIPKPFSTGVLFGSGAERMAEAFLTDHPDAFKGFFHSLAESTVGDVLPNAVTPMLEQSANRTQYTGRTLIPSQLEKQLPEYQYAPYTTELAKKLGSVIAAFPGMREGSTGQAGDYGPGIMRALTSPMLIENYVRGWTGTLGTYAMKAIDKTGRMVGALDDPQHAAATLADYPIIKAFVARYPSANAQPVSDFYEGYERNARYFATFKAQMAEGNEEAMQKIQDAGGDQMFSQLDAIKKTVGEHYTMIRTIDADPDMKPYEKRQLIDSLYYGMIETAKQGNAMLKEMGH
jgi:hypothetical protein